MLHKHGMSLQELKDAIIARASDLASQAISSGTVVIEGKPVEFHSGQIKFVTEVLSPSIKTPVMCVGSAGTGKSTVIRFIQETIEAARDDVMNEAVDAHTKSLCAEIAVCVGAPTGSAAINIGGSTMHSHCRIPIQHSSELQRHPKNYIYTMPSQELSNKIFFSNRNREPHLFWRNIVVLIVDEYTMLDKSSHRWMIEFLKKFAHGIRLVFLCDPLQLAPVVTKVESDKDESVFVFQTKEFAEMNPRVVLFREEHGRRFDNDPILKELAFLIRETRVRDPLKTTGKSVVATVQERLLGNPPESWASDYTTICFKNDTQVCINDAMRAATLRKNPKPEYTFKTTTWSDDMCIGRSKNVDYQRETNELVSRYSDTCVFEGARVMVTYNILPSTPNGLIGTVTKVHLNPDGTPCAVSIETDEPRKECHYVSRVDITIKHNGFVVAGVNALPVCLAWAITMYKAQGQTLTGRLLIHGTPWGSGQLYVALTRAVALTGSDGKPCVLVDTPLQEKHFKMDAIALSFVRACEVAEERDEDIVTAMRREMPREYTPNLFA